MNTLNQMGSDDEIELDDNFVVEEEDDEFDFREFFEDFDRIKKELGEDEFLRRLARKGLRDISEMPSTDTIKKAIIEELREKLRRHNEGDETLSAENLEKVREQLYDFDRER